MVSTLLSNNPTMFFNKKVTIQNEELTIILQGLPHRESLNNWIENYSNWNVIVSTWESVDLSEFEFPKNWKIIQSKYPLYRFHSHLNLDYQIETSLRGLYEVQTTYAIKARLDEYWSNLDIVLNKIKRNKEKIVSSSMYFRKRGFSNDLYRFHIGDKFLGGTTDNLILMFESTLQNIQEKFWDTNNPEGQLGLGYIMGKESNIDFHKIQSELNQTNVDKPKLEEVIKHLNSIINDIVSNGVMISTKFTSYLIKDIDIDTISDRVKDISVKSNWLNTQFNNYKKSKFNGDGQLMEKWFEIQDINELKPYIATRNFGPRGRVFYKDDFDHKREDCIIDIKDY